MMTDNKSFVKARKLMESDGSALEVKHQIKRPIGWRTRGSATLELGTGKNNIVLQKGGIKTDPNFDMEQENEHIVELFLNRTPGQQLEYTIGIGLKDMHRHGADFVGRSITKRLSMEFDWKRKPVKPKDVEFEFNEKKYKHIYFNTKPLENKDEFDEIRSSWENYTKGKNSKRTIIKTFNDYNEYENYRLQKKNPYGSKRSYIPRTNSDMRKLMTSLTRAFKQQKAGFTKTLNGKKITHKMFIEHLKDVGIECKGSDLDNAKRFDYEPHTAGFTVRAAKAAELLKAKYYPNLNLADIFDERYEPDLMA